MKIVVQGKTHYVKKYTPSMVMEASRLLEKGTGVSLGDEADFLDEVVPFIANSVFSGAFSPDDFLNGYQSGTVMLDILGILGAVRGVVMEELAKFPPEDSPKNGQRGKAQKATPTP